MEFSISQQCPSCGASIILHEDDRLIRCEYCDVSNYRIEAVLRYALPVMTKQVVDPENIIYVPYIRLKGTLLTVATSGVAHRILDTTCAAVEGGDFAPSLGLKPQAMQIFPVIGKTGGRFVSRQRAEKEIFAYAIRVSDLFAGKKLEEKVLQRQFVGETVSWIYHPFFVYKDKLYDGISGRPSGASELVSVLIDNSQTSNDSWNPRFISTHCPACGGLLQGARDSLVLACENCQKHWREVSGAFCEVEYIVTDAINESSYFLPFWEILLGQEGQLKNFGDYLRFTNQPRVIRQQDDRTPLHVFIPAFKINPKTFIQLAAQMTMSQTKLAQKTPANESAVRRIIRTGTEKIYPVTLGQKEAVQTMKAVIAMTTIDKKRSLPLIKDLQLSITGLRLNYLPFAPMNQEYVQEQTGGAVSAAALRYGRRL